MTTNDTTPKRRTRPVDRGIVILGIIHDNPGLDALKLRDHGIRPHDGRLLQEMENTSRLIEYKNGGWRLTAKGDLRLLSSSPVVPADG